MTWSRCRKEKMNTPDKRARTKLIAISITAALALSGAATALAVTGPDEGIPTLTRTSLLERSLEAHASRERYRDVYEQAEKFHIEPKRSLAEGVARTPELTIGAAALSVEVASEKARARVRKEREPEYGTPESVGVDQGTLDAIAACESGGDPTAVDSSGTYRGKYQFDLGTWASVGGSGDPAAAPEAEQDYRAAVLLSQAGSSPWPVCG
ncbi:MAG: transglycosylase family protein [Solirubrobacterales bacterium]|nr:transglycosylase family protein [Solirubrobacterales bacterium]